MIRRARRRVRRAAAAPFGIASDVVFELSAVFNLLHDVVSGEFE